MFLILHQFYFGCISHGLDIVLTTLFYLWLSSMIQVHVLLLQFIYVLFRLCKFKYIPSKPNLDTYQHNFGIIREDLVRLLLYIDVLVTESDDLARNVL